MAREAIAWPEGAIYLYTGTATASALLAYGSDINGTLARGWNNYVTLDDVYHDTQTGRRVDLSIGCLYTVGNSALRAFEAAGTAVHIHLFHSGIWGSAGYRLYSGRIDRLALVGREGDFFRHAVTYHANEWSSY